MRKQVIFLVEIGWHGMREFSLFLKGKGIFSTIIIKGRVSPDILNIITKYPQIEIISIKRNFFRIYTFFKIIKEKLIGNLKCVVVSKDRTKEWVGKIGRITDFKTFTLIEENGSYKLLNEKGKEVEKEKVLEWLESC